MATSVVAYKECFGFDAPPYTYADLEESDVVVLIGSNLAIAHPILWERLMRNPHSPAVVVIDPRYTETAQGGTHHLPLAPKSDLVLLYGLAQRLLSLGAVDEEFVAAHTTGFSDFRDHVAGFGMERVVERSGLPAEQIDEVAQLIASGERVSFWWTMGVNQGHEATRTAQAIIALALMTGNIGRPGTGANSITGQCNAMGSRLFSNTASMFGGRDFESAEDRREVAGILGIDEEVIPDRRSLAYDQIIEGIATGAIRGLWVIATNPAHSWINHSELHELLGRLEFLVVQDLYADTETALRADLFLPAAGWSEKEGTLINSERRIGRVRASRKPPGQARTDFEIFKGIAEVWGCGPMLRKWRDPEKVFAILQELSRGRPCDITGIESYEGLNNGGVPWPAAERSEVEAGGELRLFEDGTFFTPDGRARFVWDDPRPLPERVSGAYPLVLLTGRGSTAQWHTQTRTRRSPVLAGLGPSELHVEISCEDATRLGIESGDELEVESKRGQLEAIAWVTPTMQEGQVFLPMHDDRVNRLTFPAVDPHSRQPAYKAGAVRVRSSRARSPATT
jgi:assimilatory nitrate reductase catalytic subunit